MKKTISLLISLAFFICCEELDDNIDKHSSDTGSTPVELGDVALLLSEIRIGTEQMREVHDAVSISNENGYDNEYLMKDLFTSPGSGVGSETTRADEGSSYEVPLKDLIFEALQRRNVQTRSSAGNSPDGLSAEEYMNLLTNSTTQIYWPGSENWDGKTLPVITFDPADGSTKNIGYRIAGNGEVEEVIVDEQMSLQMPVWVINNNEDSSYKSLEVLRRQDPQWGLRPGGEIIVGGKKATKAPDGTETSFKTLILKDFTMLRNYDTWFRGANEFFVKIGSVECFTASTEAELKLYSPSITDFMIVVKRSELGKPRQFNAVLVSEWTEQLSQCAFMIIEDDGGTVTSWKCSATVKYNSKSYGFDIEIPYRESDDIVWRGSLSQNYINATTKKTGHFGDVDLTFEIVEYTY